MKHISLANGGVTIVDDSDFHWLSQRKWYWHSGGYAKCDLWGLRGGIVKVYMHRLILLAPDTATVDHINGDGLDNRRANLRLATRSQQNMNRPKYHGRSRFKGVHRRGDGFKWCAQIKANGKHHHLGSFDHETDAALAYDEAARNLHGEFARLNLPEVNS